MKLAIFGYPRSGTTMLLYIIQQHLLAAKVIEDWSVIYELFNPQEATVLLPVDGHLTQVMLPDKLATPQSRDSRLKLFVEHMDDDYILKCLAFDMHAPAVRNALLTAGYEFIAVERRNPLEAYLSSIIAYHHQVWNIRDENDRPVYEPFVVPEQEMMAHGLAMSYYYYYRDRLNPRAVLYYEDMVSQSTKETLQSVDLYHDGVKAKDSPTKKLHTLDDKAKLILNLDEVMEHYYSISLTWGMV